MNSKTKTKMPDDEMNALDERGRSREEEAGKKKQGRRGREEAEEKNLLLLLNSPF